MNYYVNIATFIRSSSSISQPLTYENRTKICSGPTNLQIYLQSDERSERISIGLYTQPVRKSIAEKGWEASWENLGGMELSIVESGDRELEIE